MRPGEGGFQLYTAWWMRYEEQVMPIMSQGEGSPGDDLTPLILDSLPTPSPSRSRKVILGTDVDGWALV